MNFLSILPIVQLTSSRIINNATMSLLGYPQFLINQKNNDYKFYEIEQIIEMAEKIETIIGEKPYCVETLKL